MAKKSTDWELNSDHSADVGTDHWGTKRIHILGKIMQICILNAKIAGHSAPVEYVSVQHCSFLKESSVLSYSVKDEQVELTHLNA